MRIHSFLGGEAELDACTRYRQVYPARALAEQGVDIETFEEIPNVVWCDVPGEDGKPDPRVVDWEPDCDIAMFQRPLARDMADLIQIAATKCVVVIDMDDDFFGLPRENKAWAKVQPHLNPMSNTSHLKRALDAAHLVTVTTPALAVRYGGKRHTRVIPNYIPEWVTRTDPEPHSPCVGWTGTMATHPRDLESTHGHIGRALNDQSDFAFVVVGDGHGVQTALDLGPRVPFFATGWVAPELYFQRMSEVDLGVVPLSKSGFNNGKSWLKMLEFAALGVPVLGSNTPANYALARMGVGQVIKGAGDWTTQIRRFLASSDLRAEVAGQSKALVETLLTMENNAYRWHDAYLDVLADRYALA